MNSSTKRDVYKRQGHACPIDEEMIRIAGDDDTNIQTGKRSHTQCLKNAVIRHEIGCSQKNIAFGFIYHFEIAVADVFPLGIGAAGDNLRPHTLYLLLLLGEIFFTQMNQPEFCGEVPVHDEAHLHLIDGIALKAQMGISPRAVAVDDTEAVSYTHLDVYKRQQLFIL